MDYLLREGASQIEKEKYKIREIKYLLKMTSDPEQKLLIYEALVKCQDELVEMLDWSE